MPLLAFAFARRAGRLERLGNLVVKLNAVSHNHKGPVAMVFAQNLLREKDHREALAAARRLPEDSTAAVTLFPRLKIEAMALFTPST